MSSACSMSWLCIPSRDAMHLASCVLVVTVHIRVCACAICRDLHKEVVAGIDEAMARHAQETDKVDLLTLKKLKGRVNVLEQQIVTDKAKQLTVGHLLPEQCIWVLSYPQTGLYELPHVQTCPIMCS